MSSKADRKAALEAIRSGKRNYEHKEAVPIYDEVDDDEFKKIHRDRMNRDDFVEEDSKDATGYADNGMDDWDREGSDDEEEERRAFKKSKPSSSKLPKSTSSTSLKRKPKVIIPEGANPFLKPGQTTFKNEPTAIVEDDFMAGLLGDLDEKVTVIPTSMKASISRAVPIKTNQTRKSYSSDLPRPNLISTSSSSKYLHNDRSSTSGMVSSDGIANGSASQGIVTESLQDLDFGGGEEAGDEDVEMNVKDEEDDDDDMQIRVEAPKPTRPIKRGPLHNGALKPNLPPPKVESMEVDEDLPTTSILLQESKSSINKIPSLKPDGKPKGTDWRTASAGLTAAAPIIIETHEDEEEDANGLVIPDSLKNKNKKLPVRPTPNVKALSEDGSLAFYWFDYVEPVPGVLYLIGKVKVNGETNSKKWVSACVGVTGIKRKLYILPRERAQDMDGEDLDEDGPPEFDDIEADFLDAAGDRWGVKNVECTPGFVRKKYAFDFKDVPREESNWVEASADFPPRGKSDIPTNASSGTFSHVFGTNTATFELFVIGHKIMGPCWLKIENPKVSDKNISWTKLEIEASTKDISVYDPESPTYPKALPTLTTMSISTRTVVNVRENKKEIVIASARIWTDNDIDDITPIEKQPSSVSTFIRKLHTGYPKGFEQHVRSHKSIKAVDSEKELLVKLLALVHAADPDIIVGHDLIAGELDVILHRMRENKTENWSQIGRLRRERWPARAPSALFAVKMNSELLGGRLLCDLASDGAKGGIIDSVTFSLSEMSDTYLKIDREEFDPDDHPMFFDEQRSTLDKLLKFTLHCEADCYFQMAIASAVQILPLTRQLTTLAGNSWNKTLGGNRAERNEYILLHRFTERGYVCPDKLTHKEREAKNKANENKKIAEAKANGYDDENSAKIVMKKEKFKGGLVFEPIKGLCDTYVLVMDYNSLYPSIMQEYDIDFSTIDWTQDDAEDFENQPEREACEGEPKGILPQLIAHLVERRKNVKKLMKDATNSAARNRQYNITQMALKVTANSMYGCLGYEYGRFFARPLAALTTYKGREILKKTKADAESLNLRVIYGDTDSVMIDTQERDYVSANKIGFEFKKLINEKYKKLEIDSDGTYKRILLLAKKKYAAVKEEENGSTKHEIKGLDMKRREFCEVSKAASRYVLDQILTGDSIEIVTEQIHDYLTELGENIRGGKVALEDFIIYKRLGKDANAYPDAKSQAHVQVALRLLAKGQSAKSGDVIPHIFCLPEDGVSATSNKAINAYHPDEVRKKGSNLQIDYGVYLVSQILPAIARLCEHIEGTSKSRLAEFLGIESKRHNITDIPEREFTTLQSQQSDAERFKDAESFHFRCRTCNAESKFDGLASTSKGPFTPYGLRCVNSECSAEISLASLSVQIDLLCRQFITKFYEQWLLCDDSSCANRTRMMSVYGKRCLAADCRGQMHFEYTDSQLYNQLLFLDGLFDSDSALKKASASEQDEIRILIDANKASINALRSVVTSHLSKNGRRFVNMAGLFSFV